MSIKIYNPQLAGEVATDLLKIGAIKLNPKQPYTWASGWKSPIYCDNRLSLSFPNVRSKLKNILKNAIADVYSEVDVIAGVATAGIPLGVLVADELELPFIYVRSKSKGHGLQNMIEGKIEKDQKVVLIEDLVSTGGSSLLAADALRDAGAKVIGMGAIFTYGFKIAKDNFKLKGIDLTVLCDYYHLLEHARKIHKFENHVLKILEEWGENPSEWMTK